MEKDQDCIIWDSWIFDHFILADELFVKLLRILETCVSVNDNLCGKLVSPLESPITFNERFQGTSVLFFVVANFNLLSCELHNLKFKVLYWMFLCWYYINILILL